MAKISDKRFTQDLHSLRGLANSIVAAQKRSITKDNAKDIKNLLTDFESELKTLKSYELTQSQKIGLKEVENIVSKRTKESLSQQVDPLVAEIKEAKEQQKKQEVEIRAIEETLDDLFAAVDEAGKKFLLADLSNMDELYEDVKAARKDLRSALNKLPNTQRQQGYARFNEESRDVTEHKKELEAQIKVARKTINNAIKNAADKVSRWTVKELLAALLPGTAQDNLARISGSNAVKLIQGSATDAVSVHSVGNLVLADLSQQAQGALIRVLLNELATTTAHSEMGALAQFIKVIEKDIESLLSGKKTHLSIIYPAHGYAQTVHVDLQALLRSPELILNELFLALYKQGVRDDAVIMTLTSPAEVAALLQIQGLDIKALPAAGNLSELTGQIIRYASSSKDLTALIQKNVSEQSLLASLHGITLDTESRGFTSGQVVAFIGIMAAMMEARAELLKNPAMQNNAGLENRPVNGIQFIQFGPPNPIAGSTPALAIENKKSADKLLDVSEEAEKFYKLIDELSIVLSKLQLKANREFGHLADDYRAAYDFAFYLKSNLKNAGDLFFGAPVTPQSFAQFKSDCAALLNGDNARELQKHRDVWYQIHPIIRGILGVLATLTIIPALIVTATSTHGYVGTFFSTPKTDSAVALENVETKLNTLEDKVEAKINLVSR